MRLLLALPVLLLIGCGDDAADPAADAAVDEPDADPYQPRLCAIPTGLPDPQVISGDIYQDQAEDPSPDATVELVSDDDATVLASAVTDAAGHFSLAGVANNGRPVRAHFRITKVGYAPSAIYSVGGWPSTYMAMNLYTTVFHDDAAALYGTTWDHDTGIAAISFRECGLVTGLEGAKVAVVPGPETIYPDAAGAPSSRSTTSSSGQALVFGVPAGAAAIDVDYDGRLTTEPFEVEAGTFTFVIYRP